MVSLLFLGGLWSKTPADTEVALYLPPPLLQQVAVGRSHHLDKTLWGANLALRTGFGDPCYMLYLMSYFPSKMAPREHFEFLVHYGNLGPSVCRKSGGSLRLPAAGRDQQDLLFSNSPSSA